MVTPKGTTRLFETQFSIESGYQPTWQPKVAQEVQAFPNSQQSSLTLSQDTRFSSSLWGSTLIFLPFTLIAALFAYGCLRSQTLILNKVSNQFRVNIQTILGPRTKTYPLDALDSIKLREYRNDGYLYQLIFKFQGDKQYALPFTYRARTAYDVADQCQAFLNKSLETAPRMRQRP